MPAEPSSTVTLEFDPETLTIGDTDVRTGLSAVAVDGDHLWLACDEGSRLERLSRRGDRAYGHHAVFALEDLLRLPANPTEEADIEGLDVDDRWLWLAGSHSVKRKKPGKDDSPKDAAKKLSVTTRDGNRHLLARIPLSEGAATRAAGEHRAAALRATRESSELLDAIRSDDAGNADPHLAPFIPLPGKDNGFDCEGLAVRGSRVFVGLRSPVLREWCCILELHVDEDGDRLTLRRIDGERRYRKHFLKLSALGVRDLTAQDDDLLILVGPAMAHDGPQEIWRWPRALKGDQPPADSPKRVVQLPQREQADRAEGMTRLPGAGDDAVLIVFDSPSPDRLHAPSAVRADVWRVP